MLLCSDLNYIFSDTYFQLLKTSWNFVWSFQVSLIFRKFIIFLSTTTDLVALHTSYSVSLRFYFDARYLELPMVTVLLCFVTHGMFLFSMKLFIQSYHCLAKWLTVANGWNGFAEKHWLISFQSDLFYANSTFLSVMSFSKDVGPSSSCCLINISRRVRNQLRNGRLRLYSELNTFKFFFSWQGRIFWSLFFTFLWIFDFRDHFPKICFSNQYAGSCYLPSR